MTRSLVGDEQYVYRGVVVWRRPDGTTERRYIGPFVSRVAALQAANREVGPGTFHGWDENDNRVVWDMTAKFVERAALVWDRWEES